MSDSMMTLTEHALARNEQHFKYIYSQICQRLHGDLSRQIVHDLVLPQLDAPIIAPDATAIRRQELQLYAALTEALEDVVLGVINGYLDREGIHPLTPREIKAFITRELHKP